MSVFPMLANVIDRMDAIRRNFLWQENCDPNDHNFHLVKWDEVMQSKRVGGLGIRTSGCGRRQSRLGLEWRPNGLPTCPHNLMGLEYGGLLEVSGSGLLTTINQGGKWGKNTTLGRCVGWTRKFKEQVA
ncbi:hypothetical protein H5410_045814 [Solanum commersonii]|uniref:Uncharacterized protein n=1 Tax=Solanum commersonii TaxID=4109 RepID=A0A9J5XDU6_SOLCO|nr:hypothetical protein H5410_045814 [Solanum commersonii]